LIKNKKLKPDDEKQELELWKKGQLQVDEVKEDAGAVEGSADKPVKTVTLFQIMRLELEKKNSMRFLCFVHFLRCKRTAKTQQSRERRQRPVQTIRVLRRSCTPICRR
jgi:hypothetical protein